MYYVLFIPCIYAVNKRKKSHMVFIFLFHITQALITYASTEATQNSNNLHTVTLTHWGRATHICVGNLTIIASYNGLSPDRRQAIIWTNAEILLIGPLGINFNEILIGIHTFSFKKIPLKMSSAKWRPFCLVLNVLNHICLGYLHHIAYIFSHFSICQDYL